MRAPIALIDANVLYAAPLRDLFMQIAVSRLFRARWTARIDDEWTRNLLANRSDITAAQIEYTKAMMIRAVPDGIVEGYEDRIADLLLPDADNRHVLAAAINAQADVIVTLNRRDCPRSPNRTFAVVQSNSSDCVWPHSSRNFQHNLAARTGARALQHFVRGPRPGQGENGTDIGLETAGLDQLGDTGQIRGIDGDEEEVGLDAVARGKSRVWLGHG